MQRLVQQHVVTATCMTNNAASTQASEQVEFVANDHIAHHIHRNKTFETLEMLEAILLSEAFGTVETLGTFETFGTFDVM